MGKVIRNVQDEPLYTVRPRYVINQAETGARGTRAKFTLLSFLKTTKKFQDKSPDRESAIIRERLLGKSIHPYADFLITGLSYGFQEKIQLQPLFGDKTAAFAFGAAPVVLQIQGVVMDDIDNNWFYKLMLLYRDHLRGTKLARNFELAQLSTNNAVFTGIIMSLGVSQESNNDCMVAFNMQFLVREAIYLPSMKDAPIDVGSFETMTKVTTDGTYSYSQVRDKKSATLEQLQIDSGLTTQQKFGNTTVTYSSEYRGDKDAVLNVATGGSLTGVKDYLLGLKDASLNPDTKLTMFESYLLKKGASSEGQVVLSALGTYGNFIDTLNTEYIGGFGSFVGEIQRNVEAFNRVIGYVGVSELVDTAANIRDQVNRMNNLVSTVKESYNKLKNLKNIFQDLRKEFDNIEQAWGNLRGSVSNFNESTADRLKKAMGSSSADLPAVLGNAALGISKEEAAAILGISSTSSSDPLASLSTGAGQNTSLDDIVASLAARTGQTEAEAENRLLATFSTRAPSKAVIPTDRPTTISSSSNTAILVF